MMFADPAHHTQPHHLAYPHIPTELTHVATGGGYRPLEQLLYGCMKGFVSAEVVVELFQRFEKPVYFLLPRQRGRIVPNLLTLRNTQAPIEQIAHVGHDLNWSAGR